MNLFDYGLGVFLEMYKYSFQFALICVVGLPVLTFVAYKLSMKSINNQEVKMDHVSVLEDKNVEKSKE